MTQLTIIVIYLLLLLGLGLFSSKLFRGTSKDYLLASHSIGPIMLLMSLFGTTMTAFALVGSTGESFKEGAGVYGLLASSSGIIHSLCFFILGVKLWSLGRKYGYTTQIQYFRDRLESDRIGILLFPILVGLVIPYLLIGVMASGTVINSISEGAFHEHFAAYDYGVPPWLGSAVICVVVLIYVFFGGMRGTAMANTAQTIVFMVLGVITFMIISDKLGGFTTATNKVLEKNPSKMMREVDPADQERYETAYKNWKTLAYYNFARQEKGLTLSESQLAEAMAAYKGPPGPAGEIKKTRAPAIYAAANGLLTLTDEEKNRALLKQDDRVASGPVPTDRELTHHELAEYPRHPDADDVGIERFAALIGHPETELPNGKKKWTIKKAKGVYRATMWAPDEPRGMDPWLFLTYFFVPLSVGMFPHLFQHWLTARNANTFKLAVVAHPVFIMIVWVPCVLLGVWMTSATVTPDKLPAAECAPMEAACDAHLRAVLRALQPEWVIGVGGFAEERLRRAVDATGLGARLGRVLHPSPASPAANRGWAEAAKRQLVQQGVWT